MTASIPGLLVSPSAAPERYPTHRCLECTLVRCYAPESRCPECDQRMTYGNVHSTGDSPRGD